MTTGCSNWCARLLARPQLRTMRRKPGMSTEPLSLDTKAALRGLLDVAKVALGPDMPEVPDEEAVDLIIRLLAVVDRAMPPDLRAQDARILTAHVVADLFKQ